MRYSDTKKRLGGKYWYIRPLLVGLATIITVAMMCPLAADAYLPVRTNPPGVPSLLGGPPIFDGGYRAWEQTRHQKSWWKRDRTIQFPSNGTVPSPTN